MLARRQIVGGFGLLAAASLMPKTLWAGDGLAPPPDSFSSNINYFIYGGGQPIVGLKVTIEVSDDVIAPTGLNMQLNGNSPFNARCVYQQYCMGMDPNHETRLGWSNENFPSPEWRMALYNQHHHNCHVTDPQPGTCTGDIFNMNTGQVGVFPAMTNRLPAGCKLIWELINGPDGSVIGASYSYAHGGKTTSTGPQMIDTFPFDGFSDKVGPKSMAPILAFQMNMVGLNNSARTHVKEGGAGTITYEAATPLEPRGSAPPGIAASNKVTGESSNITYAQLAAGPKQRIVQGFGTPYTARPATGPTRPYVGNEAGPTCPQGTTSLSKSCQVGNGHVIVNDKAPPTQQPR